MGGRRDGEGNNAGRTFGLGHWWIWDWDWGVRHCGLALRGRPLHVKLSVVDWLLDGYGSWDRHEWRGWNCGNLGLSRVFGELEQFRGNLGTCLNQWEPAMKSLVSGFEVSFAQISTETQRTLGLDSKKLGFLLIRLHVMSVLREVWTDS